jgi:hypothetical protein
MSLRKVVHDAANYVTGNQAGLSGNLEGRRILREARRGVTWDDSTPNAGAESLATNGYAVLPLRFDEALISGLRDDFNVKVDDPEHAWSTPDGAHHTSFYNPVVSMPDVAKLIDSTIIDAVQSYYKCYMAVTDVMAWRNRPFSPNATGIPEVYSSQWHFDGSQLNGVCYFVSLRDITENDGPFHTHNKEHTKKLVRQGFKRGGNDIKKGELESPEHVSLVTGPAGTNYCGVVSKIIHRAGIPADGHFRDVIKFGFDPSPTPLSENWADAYLDRKKSY